MARDKVPNIFRPNPQIIAPCAYDRKLAAQLAAQYTQDAIDRLVYWMNQDDEPAVSLAATRELVYIAYGKPKEAKDDPASKSPLRVTVEFVKSTPQSPVPDMSTIENVTPTHNA